MTRNYIQFIVAAVLTIPLAAPGATVTYHGSLTEFGSPNPNLADDFVIAGTFPAGFDPRIYTYLYGDSVGNLTDPHFYSDSIADGIWHPIGTGTLADSTGAFSGSGTATGIDGLPIYLFLFSRSTPDLGDLALVGSSSPTWYVENDGVADVDGSLANNIVLGYGVSGGKIILGIPPIPEPGSMAFVLIGAALGLQRRGWRKDAPGK